MNIRAIALALLLCLCLTACGGEPEEDALSGDRTGGWIHLENGLRVCHSVRAVSLPRRYSSMARAAARPAPMARITVAAPVTASARQLSESV